MELFHDSEDFFFLCHLEIKDSDQGSTVWEMVDLLDIVLNSVWIAGLSTKAATEWYLPQNRYSPQSSVVMK